MNPTSARLLLAAALLAMLAACGNKGPLVKPSQAQPPAPEAAPVPAPDPTDSAPAQEIPQPPAADPASATPTPPPADDDGGDGND
jgi:predicted small lipoprotein YifL